MRFDLSEIMSRAWRLFREKEITFPEALHRSWLSAKAASVNDARIAEAKAAAGISEDVDTWAGWKKQGREVVHGSKALFGVDLIWGSRGDGAVYKARFFGLSQTAEIPESVA